MELLPGDPARPGATWDGEGVHFVVFSRVAEAVELCLFDAAGEREVARGFLPECTHDLWHGFLPQAGPGTVYGYRVHGPWRPEAGLFCNPAKLLLDPWARELAGRFRWHEAQFGYRREHWQASREFLPDGRDNAPWMPKGVVAGPLPPPRPLGRPVRRDAVFYELHVRGFTIRHAAVPEALAGTLEGLALPEVLEHLRALGVTAVELMPVQAHLDEWALARRGLVNYWGYNPLSFFAVEPRYAGASPTRALRDLVEACHRANLEVVLDLVFNHTGEGDESGPTFSWRGFDNAFYRLDPAAPHRHLNFSGCGNSLNLAHPRVLQLVMDALRHFAGTCGVDGFRFDLATTLGRGRDGGFDPEAPFFQALAQDPLLAGRHFVAEPWDLGPEGHQLGAFPPGFAEWNDRYRDAVRRFWSGAPGALPELARRLAGSAELYEPARRRPWAGVDYVACHDGPTLRDLAARILDRPPDGPLDAPLAALIRALLATWAVSQGALLLGAGDEFGRTQRGEENAYTCDDERGWVDWRLAAGEGAAILSFCRALLALRREFDGLLPDRFRHVLTQPDGEGLSWFHPEGRAMTPADWQAPEGRRLAMAVSRGGRHLLALINGAAEPCEFRLPALAARWHPRLASDGRLAASPLAPATALSLPGRAVVLLTSWRQPTEEPSP
ncbi:MAG: glycogen operon protein GlgX homolog [Porticoccaceae bacterium]|nr:MAG: glycogen operon protein GlgX homolog [Porticoccaceae bacterium]